MAKPAPIAPAPDVRAIDAQPALKKVEPGRISASKQWVLPPRPKPGRKPKQRPHAGDEGSPVPNPDTRNGVKPSEDDTCGLCTKEGGCLCDDIGLRQRSTAPGQPQADATVTVVPLRSRRTEGPKVQKFRRADEGPIKVAAEPPSFRVNMSPTESCGFCTSNTPCLCAGDAIDSGEEVAASSPSPHKTGTSATSAAEKMPLGGAATLVKRANTDVDYGCPACQQEPMSTLFCVSLGAAQALDPGAVAIPCTMAFRTIEKHPKFSSCDLGVLVQMLESQNKMIGVQSINRALQYMNGKQ